MESILLITNCKKYKQNPVKQKIMWLKKKDIPPYYHIIGDKEYCKDKKYIFDEKNRILYTNTGDGYNELPSKIITAFRAVYETMPNIKYVFKTDDNQYLVNVELFTKLKYVLSHKDICYGGHTIRVTKHISTLYITHPEFPKDVELEETIYCTGPFYFLRRDALKNLLEKEDEIYKRYVEDHAMGYYLDDVYKNKLLTLPDNFFIELN